VLGFLQTWRLAFRPKCSILFSSDQRILFLMIWESLGAFWQTPSRLSCAFYWGVASIWPLYHKGLMVVLLEGSQSPEELSSSIRVIIGFLVTSLTKALLPQLLSLARRPAQGRVLVVPNFFHWRMMETTVFLGTFNAADIFWYPSPDLCLDTILSRRSTDNSFDLMAWFVNKVYVLSWGIVCRLLRIFCI
jgi:hypothetical protein